MRISVSVILKMLAGGKSLQDVLDAYPELETEDVRQAMQFAAWVVADQVQMVPVKQSMAPSLRSTADMNLSPLTVNDLRRDGWEIVRVSDFLPADASDDKILAWTRSQNSVLITQDLDFSTLLALAGSRVRALSRCASRIPILVLLPRVSGASSPK